MGNVDPLIPFRRPAVIVDAELQSRKAGEGGGGQGTGDGWRRGTGEAGKGGGGYSFVACLVV